MTIGGCALFTLNHALAPSLPLAYLFFVYVLIEFVYFHSTFLLWFYSSSQLIVAVHHFDWLEHFTFASLLNETSLSSFVDLAQELFYELTRIKVCCFALLALSARYWSSTSWSLVWIWKCDFLTEMCGRNSGKKKRWYCWHIVPSLSWFDKTRPPSFIFTHSSTWRMVATNVSLSLTLTDWLTLCSVKSTKCLINFEKSMPSLRM